MNKNRPAYFVLIQNIQLSQFLEVSLRPACFSRLYENTIPQCACYTWMTTAQPSGSWIITQSCLSVMVSVDFHLPTIWCNLLTMTIFYIHCVSKDHNWKRFHFMCLLVLMVGFKHSLSWLGWCLHHMVATYENFNQNITIIQIYFNFFFLKDCTPNLVEFTIGLN